MLKDIILSILKDDNNTRNMHASTKLVHDTVPEESIIIHKASWSVFCILK